jgi:hypothetical protein
LLIPIDSLFGPNPPDCLLTQVTGRLTIFFRKTRDDAERRETAERDVRVRLAKELRDANAAAAKAKKEAAALGGVLIGGPPREGAVPVATASTVNSSLAMPGGPGISASPQKTLNLNAPVSPTAVHKPGPATGGSTEASGFPGPVAGVGGDGQGIGTTGAVTAPGIDTTGQSNGMDMNGIGTTGAVNEKSGKKHHGPKSGENPGGGTPLGKGRKLCARCSQIVGSPTRVCPHCQHTLPMKEAKSPKGEGKGGGVSGGGGGASGAGPPVPTGAGANGYGQLVIPGQLLSGPGPTGDSENPVQSSVAHFLSRHVAKFTNCKVSQLKRNVLELGGGIGAILDAGKYFPFNTFRRPIAYIRLTFLLFQSRARARRPGRKKPARRDEKGTSPHFPNYRRLVCPYKALTLFGQNVKRCRR